MKEDEVKRRAFAMPLTSPAYPDRSLPLRQPRISDHHLPHRSGQAARARAGAAAGRRAAGEVRVHPHAGLDRLRRLHRERTGHPGVVERPQGRLQPLHVPRRPSADRRRPRAVGLSQEARQADAARRDRHPGRHARLRPGADRHRHHGLQAQGRRPRRRQGVAAGAELPAQDHAACRRHAAHLRAGRILPGGRRPEGRLDRPGGART